jgi:hypothetical protein
MNAETIGGQIGRAIARDALADGMPREWTGLDPQDADQIPDGLDQDEVEEYARRAYATAIDATERHLIAEGFVKIRVALGGPLEIKAEVETA